MTDGSGLQPAEDEVKTTLYRPGAEGGLEATAPDGGDYRDDLRSRRWNAAPLENPEVEKTDPRIAVAGLILFAAVTFTILVVGYGSEMEMETWAESMMGNADWAAYLTASRASAQYLGASMIRDIKAWGAVSLGDLAVP